ncbi:MAG TPA: hypothetical protein H9898_01120 [Candidatus Anaerobiospirillum stercoravium]|nr:hypothetical protein [Candidatus Anaerobiospirillum stercoravium]
MSIRDVTHSTNIGLSVLTKSNATTASGGIAASGHANPSASAYSALLTQAREIKGVGALAPKSPQAQQAEALRSAQAAQAARTQHGSGAHGAQFAALLNQAQAQYGTTLPPEAKTHGAQAQPSSDGATASAAQTLLSGKSDALTKLASNLTYDNLKGRIAALEGKPLDSSSVLATAGYISTEAAQVISTIEAAQAYQLDVSERATRYPDEVVDLVHKQLDFSPLLPEGTRTFLANLKCSDSERDALVNLMIFGRDDGPHGQNAAQYFGAEQLSGADLSTQLEPVLERAQLNAAALAGNDYQYVLRDPQAALGQTVAVTSGASLEERALERELDSTFKRDMALMQILARANNQSASIF